MLAPMTTPVATASITGTVPKLVGATRTAAPFCIAENAVARCFGTNVRPPGGIRETSSGSTFSALHG